MLQRSKMENKNSEKKSEIWMKYCEACVSSKIEHNIRPRNNECCSGRNKEVNL